MTTQMMRTRTGKAAPKIKRCGRCHKLLPIGKFYHSRGSKDGRYGWCIGCCNSSVRERREAERARIFGPLPESPAARDRELERRKKIVLAERPEPRGVRPRGEERGP